MQRVVVFFCRSIFLGWVLFRGRRDFLKFFKWEEVFLFIYLLSLREKHHPHLGFVFYNRCSVMFLGEDWSGISRVFFRGRHLTSFFFRTVAVDLFLLFESRDDDEVAYLVYVVRNDEVG